MKKKTKTKPDLYQQITDQIVDLLESKAVLPWKQDWVERFDNAVPYNPFTGSVYRGINVILLWSIAMKKGYTVNQWATFNQIKKAGGTVKKGEKGTNVIFFKKMTVVERDEEEDSEEKKDIALLRSFTVFNLEQTNLNVAKKESKKTEKERHEAADSFIAKIGATIKHGGNQAYYNTVLDYIRMPEFSDFKTTEGYYATCLHEHTHWTGHKSRLNRNFSERFGTDAYAFEELVAELGSAFTCAHLEVNYAIEKHVSYIDVWIKILKSDKKAIFKAASEAGKASDFLKK